MSDLTVDMPPFVESGYSVPVAIAVDLPDAAFPVRIAITAPENPNPEVMTIIMHTPDVPTVTSRIRLARSQSIRVVAELSGGGALTRLIPVEVVVGGCDVELTDQK